MKKGEKILVICAHPDDETLGLGGTLALHAQNGSKVFVLIFADGQFGRDNTKKGIMIRQEQAKKACSILGIRTVKFLNYKDQTLDKVPLVELACQIESFMKQIRPDIVYTHYWGDVNQDHRKLFEATLIASRPVPSSKVKQFICFETPSSTEYGNKQFKPNLFVDIDKVIGMKIKAIEQYKNEVGQFPHPRSKEAIVSRAKYWGTSVGIKHAEAFLKVREMIRG